ncbi:hypothetical protein CGRA01v4_07309 [Colletotrichum graminicola]|uniref:Vacuolar ATPase assembly protein VMA22 n=1 Tax=Colletotrichum graminicola (strain M1.001 / M2 / FGSC 10212) TaxID=645133 RepID=E3QCB5_COLGM|nr:uncharacterized protein GLRG_03647 [Colletotrichum graminicola M1.001]EFQ28503.1 hypothetical protein GLRG_03647 [Colletotrichum graminicola M1.001]WDK16028.1 hypothetical protein CGRA01v4_07309 [Colletotrichum graminicola]
METDHIDSLLERYLVLLDKYTVLRERLGKAQAGMYQNIARANFSAERGIRYGPDYYDERMQALRVLDVSADGRGVPRFEIVKSADAVTLSKTAAVEAEAETREARGQEDKGRVPGGVDEAPHDESDTTSADGGKGETQAEEDVRTKKHRKTSKDPLRWFGILAPLPLRQAQMLSVQAVQDIIPQLASVDAEMKDVEIEVRRARKRRAKAEAALKKSEAEEVPETDQGDLQAPVAAIKSM